MRRTTAGARAGRLRRLYRRIGCAVGGLDSRARRADGAARDLASLAADLLGPIAHPAERVGRIDTRVRVTRGRTSAVDAGPTECAAEPAVDGATKATAQHLGTRRQRSDQQRTGHDRQDIAMDIHV